MGALLLESRLIRELAPLEHRRLRAPRDACVIRLRDTGAGVTIDKLREKALVGHRNEEVQADRKLMDSVALARFIRSRAARSATESTIVPSLSPPRNSTP